MRRSLRRVIFNRLLLFVISFFIVSSIVLFVAISRVSEIDKWGHLATNLELQLLSQKNIRNDFVRIEIINPQFFDSGKSQYIASNKQLQKNIQNNINELCLSKFSWVNDHQTKAVINRIYAQTVINQQLFDTLTSLVLRRGFKDWGCEGKMRECAHELEKCTEINVIDVLQLRRREKDFIIRVQPEYIDSVQNIIARIQQKVTITRAISQNKKRIITEFLNCYLKNFLEISELEMQLGIKNMSGLSQRIQLQSNEIDDELKTLHTLSNAKQEQAYNDIMYAFIFVFIVFTILSFFIVYTISNRITLPFSQLVQHIDIFIKTGFTSYDEIKLHGATKDVRNLLDNFTMMQKEIVNYVSHFREKVEERTREIEEQKNIIQLQNRNIIDSINSAKIIQQSMLQDELYVKKLVPESFISYLPKDIVSGDFYFVDWKWSESENAEILYIIAADATGHGVPGAFMSMLGLSIIKSIFMIDNSPSQFINVLNSSLYQHLYKMHKKTGSLNNFENFDLAFCSINLSSMSMQYHGANRPCYIVRQGTLIELKRSVVAIGEHPNILPKIDKQQFELQSGDMLYVFSDGYISQFGGERDKKFNISKFKDLLIAVSNHSIDKQKNILESVLHKWRGTHEQTDDVLVIGFKIP